MVVIRSLPLPKDDVWYLAYGSNLSSSKFVKDRGIVPLESAIVSVAGFTLAMESAGVPYNEPSFASIRPLDMAADPKERGLLGTAYLVTAEQYRHIIESEGGGIAYREVEVAADAIETNASDSTATEHIVARTLVTVLMRRPAPRPSLRYLNLITSGANESAYPEDYQQYLNSIAGYEPPTTGRRRIGAALFLSLWIPIMMAMEKLTKASIAWNGDQAGNAPMAVIWLVRLVMATLWWHHDYIHAPLWGRGDGLDQDSLRV